jgi:methylmalonyl-CoA mutase cobalamin-binding subunit
LAGHYQAATQVALEFMAVASGRTTVISRLFEAASAYITNLWMAGTATSDDEYRLAIAISRALDSMVALPSPVGGMSGVRALLATIAPEEHRLGLDLVATAMRDDGWDVEVVPRVDTDELVDRAHAGRFKLVGISSTYATPPSRSQLGAAVAALHRAGMSVIVGGQTFQRAPELIGEIGADASAEDVRAAVVMARRLSGRTGLSRRSRKPA